MIPKFYEFFCPVKILSGHKALANLPYEMGLLGVKNALLVTDQGIIKAGLLKKVNAAIEGSDCQLTAVFDQTPVDSSNLVVNEVAEIYRKNKCDCLIALGGGSCIDTAKGVNIVISEGTDDLMKFQGMDRLTADLKPFIVIPTTAGTGSEVTLAAVIKNVEAKIKMPFISDKLYPNLAIIDPVMTMTMPPKVTAATGMDALTHAVEAYIGLQKNPISDAFAAMAIKLVFEHLVNATKNGDDKDTRLAMANAALMAGIAFSNSMVGIVHALAHATGATCNVPHGVANAIFLPWGMEYNMDKSADKLAELAPFMGVPADKKDQAKAAVQAVRDLLRELHEIAALPTTLSEAGVGEDRLEEIAKTAVNDGSCIYNPEDLKIGDLRKVLKQAL